MTAPLARSRSIRRSIAVPAGMAMATALAFLPNVTASAAGQAPQAPQTPVATDGPSLSYVVNVRSGHGASGAVQKEITKAGGTVVVAYDKIGVIVAHSSNPDFAKTIRKAAGSTRRVPRAPLRCPPSPRPTSAPRRR